MFWMSLLAMVQSAGQPELVVPAHRWTVDYGRVACTLARRVGGEESPVLALNAPLGTEPGELVLLEAEPELERHLRRDVELRLDDGSALDIPSRRERRGERRVIRFSPMPEDFLEQLARARRLTFARDGETLLAVPLPNAGEAVEELTRCNDDLLRSWGIDVAARRALRRKPRLLEWSWALALSPSVDTYLVFVANVSERGRPLDCRVVISGGNERMDRRACELVLGRGRFEPALDADGQPVRAQYVTRIRWLVNG